MSLPFSARSWLRLPGRIALLLGLGALSVTSAAAAAPKLGQSPARLPQQSAKSFGELLIWSDAGRVYVSEGGKTEELRLGDTAEARLLRAALERHGATAASPRRLQDRMILVGGGGQGISGGHWERQGNSPSAAGQGAESRNNKSAGRAKTNSSEPAGISAKTKIAGAHDR